MRVRSCRVRRGGTGSGRGMGRTCRPEQRPARRDCRTLSPSRSPAVGLARSRTRGDLGGRAGRRALGQQPVDAVGGLQLSGSVRCASSSAGRGSECDAHVHVHLAEQRSSRCAVCRAAERPLFRLYCPEIGGGYGATLSRMNLRNSLNAVFRSTELPARASESSLALASLLMICCSWDRISSSSPDRRTAAVRNSSESSGAYMRRNCETLPRLRPCSFRSRLYRFPSTKSRPNLAAVLDCRSSRYRT
jgi:hypothetical protein